jgi:hypothetical protein
MLTAQELQRLALQVFQAKTQHFLSTTRNLITLVGMCGIHRKALTAT